VDYFRNEVIRPELGGKLQTKFHTSYQGLESPRLHLFDSALIGHVSRFKFLTTFLDSSLACGKL
jgi:hypothetical protein